MTRSNSKLSPSRLAAKRKRDSENTARFRTRHAQHMSFVKSSINEHLTRLKRPTIDFSKKKGPHVLKGKARPIHLPTAEERANMTMEDLSLWKAEERRKRKAAQARERRARTDEMEKNLRALLADLEREVREMEGREADSTEHVMGFGAVVSDGDESHADHSDEEECSNRSMGSVFNDAGKVQINILVSVATVLAGPSSVATVPFTSEAAAASALLSLSMNPQLHY